MNCGKQPLRNKAQIKNQKFKFKTLVQLWNLLAVKSSLENYSKLEEFTSPFRQHGSFK